MLTRRLGAAAGFVRVSGALWGLAVLSGCALWCDGPEPSLRTDDPTDARNITLTLMATPDQFALASTTVGIGVAAGGQPDGGAVRVRALDREGREVRTFRIPDPLRRNIYEEAGRRRDRVVHTTARVPSATVTIFLPLDAGTSAVEVGWLGQPPQRFDVVGAVRTGCAGDRHRDCVAWFAQHD
jgi:hypothetical protein